MLKKDRVVDLFADMVRQTNRERGEDSKTPKKNKRNGQVVINGGENIVNIYNTPSD